MKHVELIRQRILRGQSLELRRLKSFISMTEGNTDVLAKFEGTAGERLLAGVTDYILTQLGHVTVVPADDAASKSRRAARAAR